MTQACQNSNDADETHRQHERLLFESVESVFFFVFLLELKAVGLMLKVYFL